MDIKKIIEFHELWLKGKDDGIRANLSDADLSGADLSGADLRRADLSGADLRRADLRRADLSGANLSDANLSDANLSDANLIDADLRRANLSCADLRRADLSCANLSGANLSDIIFDEYSSFFALCCPEEGEFIAWKKCKENVIVKLKIPAESKRSSATSRKCRAEYAEVVEVFGAEFGVSKYDSSIKYVVGETVKCHEWEEDRWIECGGGIHFFITRREAELY